MKKIVSILMCLAMLISAFALPASAEENAAGGNAAMDFSVELFQNAVSGADSVTIAPLSVMYALVMTMNGAEGETLSQMEAAVGMSRDEFNAFLPAYLETLADENSPLSGANSIWIRDDENFEVNDEFVSINSDLFGAEVSTIPFDQAAVEKINGWVAEATEGRITEMLSAIPADAVMYLINALAFSSEWDIPYNEADISEGIFTAADGTEQTVDMMYATENLYIETDSATGFVKFYKDQKHAFVALLPAEGMSVQEYALTLTGKGLSEMLNNAQIVDVSTWIPRFSSEYTVEMKDMLAAMGITDAFDPQLADLSGIGDELFISGVTHKAQITVDETGTEAAASTMIGIMTMSAPPMEDPKEVCLDRPFVYMVMDMENMTPVFMGTLGSIAE